MLLIARYEGTYKQLPIRKVLNTPSRVLGTVGVAVPYCKAATSADSAGGAHEAISIHERDDAPTHRDVSLVSWRSSFAGTYSAGTGKIPPGSRALQDTFCVSFDEPREPQVRPMCI